MDVGQIQGAEGHTVHAGHCPRGSEPSQSRFPTLTLEQLQRAICCPTGQCSAPGDCFAQRRDRDVPVRIDQAARAVLELLTRGSTPQHGGSLSAQPTVVPLTTQRPGVVTLHHAVGVPQDSAWQPLPDRSSSER